MVLLAGVASAAPLDQPTPEMLTEARQIVQDMIDSPRGPYSRIRWFCNDGTVQAPVAYACQERGGGRQHAEYSPARERLAALGWSVGTIFAATTLDELRNSQQRQARLRELPLERYLMDIDDGWVLRRAQNYRGRVQAEDEAAAGAALLQQLMLDTQWSLDNFLLIRELARTIPHGEDSDLARKARRDAVELAELDSAAEKWRIEIHNNPSATTAQRLREWSAGHRDAAIAAAGNALADTLDTLYGEAGRRARIDAALAKVGSGPMGSNWRQSINEALSREDFSRVAGLCAAMASARSSLFAKMPPERRLAMIDSLRELETDVQMSYRRLVSEQSLDRAETLQISRALLECAYASGLLSQSEFDAIAPPQFDESSLSLADYRAAILRLKRAPGWAIGTIRFTFAEALIRYTALDSRAARFSDDLLRGSPMWMLGDTLKVLSRDLDHLTGSVAEFVGKPVGGVLALNPGMAHGRLRIFETLESLEGADIAETDIVVIPETIAELTPVAGILTLGEGNALSHVQLLARNFGIPNVAVDFDAVAMLEPLQDERVRLIVGSEGSVILEVADSSSTERAAAAPASVTVPVPDLSVRRLLTLDEIGRDMSGRIVGPKAANLGELNRMFPGRVAPAIAVPFGIYAEHLAAAGLGDRIAAAFQARRNDRLSQSEFGAELASVRDSIAALTLSESVAGRLRELMAAEFGAPGTYGVFVRSDTNVEDLPQFTGAGLNETIPNIVDPAAQLAAVPRVWSSILSPRALAWRSSVLSNPEQIYASVLLMKSVPATKSGVLVTTNLADRSQPAMTASVAWGVGGAVAGEAAETIVILEDDVEILSEAKAPYQRQISDKGGVLWLPASSGPVMTPAEIEQLRKLAVEVASRYEPVTDDNGQPRPWDIEFGFVDGELTLFQIRPLVERGSASADAVIRARLPASSASEPPVSRVDLDQPPAR
ncbi:MAG: PEP/pyruvate-binding domain-containing protein [Woeseiaceae bacterium]|nr:PEP/pyruvate-binding domain-containing protein [Woeseiaceae bacterium]